MMGAQRNVCGIQVTHLLSLGIPLADCECKETGMATLLGEGLSNQGTQE